MRNETASLRVSVVALSLWLGGAALAVAGNGATVDEAASGVPVSGPPGSLVGVRVRVLNTGDTTWSAGARHRLGATPANQLVWSSFPCGGYVNNVQDSRVFLCADVAPGQSTDFQFSVTLPSSGTAVLSVRMVQDGVEWFGETQAFSIAAATGCANAPLATPSDRWKLEIFGDKALSGSTVEQRYDAVGAGGFSFDWGTGRASGCTGVDNFGVRFTRAISVASGGDYKFTTTTDDGVRLWVDGQLLIDRWVDQAPASYSATRFLTAGTHDVRMDYYENGGGAVAALRWEFLGSACANAPLATPSDRWKLEIFGNKALSGTTAEQRYDAVGAGGFSFDWGTGRASSCTGVDNFGIRFTRTISVAASGDYRFTTTTDDGVRLWVDGQLLIDRWVDQAPASYAATKFLAAGTHAVRMDYYENGGGALAALRWEFLGGCANAPLATPSDRWKLEIFGNKALSGGTVEQRYDAPGAGGFSFDWGAGRPSTCTDVDSFGIRFTRTIGIASSGDYTFTATTDDGVRLWVDGQLLIDRWVDQAPASATATKFLAAGTHDLRMDYYENGGGAVAALRWDASSGAGEIYGINVDPPNPAGNPSPDDLKALGARWVRVEWKASRGPAFYDPKIRSYRDAGLKVLVIVDYATVAGKPNGTTATDADWTAYIASFVSGVRSLAQHVGDGVDAWQIWNEPDLQPHPGYDPYVPAHQYGVMLRDTAAAIRSHSSRPVVTAGLLRRDAGYLTAVRQAAGGLPVDAVVVHPYGQRAPDNWPWSTWGFGNMSDFFDTYLAFGKPLWVSEIGLSTQDSELQGQYLENVYRLVEGEYAGRVQVVFWFCWSDGMVSPFGVVDGSGKPKPAYYRYQTIAPRY